MALVLEEKKCIFSKIPQKCSVFNETQDLSFFRPGDFNRAVVFSSFTFVCLLSWPQAFFLQNSAFCNLFTAAASEMTAHWFPNFFFWSFPAKLGYLRTKIDRKRHFGCNLTRFSLIAYKSLSNPSFLSLVNRTINLVIFLSQIVKGFTLVPWQKVFLPKSLANPSLPFSLYSNDTTPIQFSQFFPLQFGLLLLSFSFRLFKTQLLV